MYKFLEQPVPSLVHNKLHLSKQKQKTKTSTTNQTPKGTRKRLQHIDEAIDR